MVMFGVLFGLIAAKLAYLGFVPAKNSQGARYAITTSRPDLTDRNGQLLATDIKTISLFAEPRRIIDADEAGERLRTVLPELDAQTLHAQLSSEAGFVWLQRKLSPDQQQRIFNLGLPGIGFMPEIRRFYPASATSSHVVGFVDVDNRGIAGMEKYVDDQGYWDLQMQGIAASGNLNPVKLSLDIRIQNIVRDELVTAMTRYKAIAAGGVILDVDTGEVRAMVSLPDYDPNDPKDALLKDRLNRMSAGTFEMGSTFKSFTTAMALDSGLVKITDSFDASRPLNIGGFTINDFHGKGRRLTVPEIFEYSSNIGTAKEAEVVGIEAHRAFLTKMGLLTRLKTELPETALPTQPKIWKKLNSITISFGHGVSTTPLQTASAAAALMNGGDLIPPTFLPRSRGEAAKLKVPVVSKKTSDLMRYLYQLNGQKGSGRSAQVAGYRVGGKTGTAEKVVNGRYSANKRFNSYVAAFPIDAPRYVVLVILDEPQVEEGKAGATAGSNAAPTVGAIIRRSAALLEIRPDFELEGKIVPTQECRSLPPNSGSTMEC
ncbi:MAG: penicillin-binding protein 2 [Myxococcota bacterium]